eukprot:471486_1
MSNWKEKRANKKTQNKANEKERRVNRRELLKLSGHKLLKKCKQYNVKYDKNRRNETVDKLLYKITTKNNKATKKNKKVKRLSLRFSVDDQEEFKQEAQKQQHQMLLQSSTTKIISIMDQRQHTNHTDEIIHTEKDNVLTCSSIQRIKTILTKFRPFLQRNISNVCKDEVEQLITEIFTDNYTKTHLLNDFNHIKH